MCGISGIIATPSSDSSCLQRIHAMSRSIAFRGPDSSGFCIHSEFAFAHRRLSILDPSDSGTQPMRSYSGRYTITYNGEIYNHLDLRSLLPNHDWRGHSDTETLIALIDKFGLRKCLPLLNGMFAFGVWDHLSKTLYCQGSSWGKAVILRDFL